MFFLLTLFLFVLVVRVNPAAINDDFQIYDLYSENDSELCPSTKNRTHTMVTMFTTIKVHASKRDIYFNTLRIWPQLSPNIRLVLYVDEVDCTEWMTFFVQNLGWEIRVIPKVHPKISIPILRYMFIDAIVNYDSSFYMYANGDVLFDTSLYETLSVIEPYILEEPKTFIVGRRRNYDVAEGELFHTLEDVTIASTSTKMDRPLAIDFFITSAYGYPWKRVPDFVVGRISFDSWLMAHAVTSGLVNIDVSGTVIALHQSGIEGSRESGSGEVADRLFNRELMSTPLNIGYAGTVCSPYKTVRQYGGEIVVHFKNAALGMCGRRYAADGFWPGVFEQDRGSYPLT